jgi:hypothetical protein
LYKCYGCGKQFLGGFRLRGQQLWQEYHSGKQTYQRHQQSIAGGSQCFDGYHLFWARFWGNVFKDRLSGTIVYKRYVKTATVKAYLDGISEIVRRGVAYNPLFAMGAKE